MKTAIRLDPCPRCPDGLLERHDETFGDHATPHRFRCCSVCDAVIPDEDPEF